MDKDDFLDKSSELYQKYKDLSSEDLHLLLDFYGKMAKLPQRQLDSPSLAKERSFFRTYENVLQVFPKLQWRLLGQGIICTLLIVFPTSLGLSIFLRSFSVNQQMIFLSLLGGFIGLLIVIFLAKFLLTNEKMDFLLVSSGQDSS